MHRVLCGRRDVVVYDAERIVARLYAGVRALVVLLKVDVFQHSAAHRRHLGVAGDEIPKCMIRNVQTYCH